MHRFSLHDDRVKLVLDAAATAIVFVHCGVLSVGIRKKLGLPSQFDMRYSNPIDVHGIALQHPNTKFVIPHFGAGFFREALMVCDLCPNVYLDTSSSNDWRRYQPSDMSLADVFKKALNVVGPDRLLFGTDSSYFPRGWNRTVYDVQVSTLHQIGVSAADAAAILGGNLERLLVKS
jgi:predicted TIM-barrel fold metal-dependent hydrolase